jgi:hypothetical protein
MASNIYPHMGGPTPSLPAYFEKSLQVFKETAPRDALSLLIVDHVAESRLNP